MQSIFVGIASWMQSNCAVGSKRACIAATLRKTLPSLPTLKVIVTGQRWIVLLFYNQYTLANTLELSAHLASMEQDAGDVVDMPPQRVHLPSLGLCTHDSPFSTLCHYKFPCKDLLRQRHCMCQPWEEGTHAKQSKLPCSDGQAPTCVLILLHRTTSL